MAHLIPLASLCIVTSSFAAAQPPPAFEVASVKPAVPGTTGGRTQFLPGGKFSATNVPLKFLIQQVYEVRDYQIVGDPRWMSIIADGYTSRYDIQAKGDSSATEAQVREMVKALLTERFQLKLHGETRELPVYQLVPARSGIKLQTARDNGRPAGSGGVAFMVKGWIEGTNVAMPSLIHAVSQMLDRPVIDKTGFTGAFDFKLTFSPGPEPAEDSGAISDGGCPASFAAFREKRGMKPEAASCPSVFTAIQEQLGLKLDPRKSPVEVLVIDHVQRPTPN